MLVTLVTLIGCLFQVENVSSMPWRIRITNRNVTRCRHGRYPRVAEEQLRRFDDTLRRQWNVLSKSLDASRAPISRREVTQSSAHN